ncbi:MAG: cupredoxin domain-containing protein [Nitrosotalea sp.]
MKSQNKKENSVAMFVCLSSIAMIFLANMGISQAALGDQQENTESQSVTKVVRILTAEHPQFTPNKINIKSGDKVIFLNLDASNGGVTHAISLKSVHGIPKNLDSGLLRVGQYHIVTFLKPGVYRYVDPIHPEAHGMIIVT